MRNSELISTIKKDYYRYYGSYKIRLSKLLFGNSGLRYIILFRLHSRLNKMNFFLRFFLFVPIYLTRNIYKTISHITVPKESEIGPGLCFFHPTNIRMRIQKIGVNCTIGHSVTIGHVNHGDKKGYPLLGNNVFIGPGAVIIGNISIGDNVVIAPNSLVMENIPSNRFVIGNPARILPSLSGTKNYIENPI